MLGLIGLTIATSSSNNEKSPCKIDIYVDPPTFSLALQWPPHFFHSRIATGSKTSVFNIQAFRYFIMSQQGKRKAQFSGLLYITKNWMFSCVLYAHSQILCSRVANLAFLKPDFEYAYYVNKLRQNVGLETWTWCQIVTSQRLHTTNKWPPYATEWNPAHENFLCTPLCGGLKVFVGTKRADYTTFQKNRLPDFRM